MSNRVKALLFTVLIFLITISFITSSHAYNRIKSGTVGASLGNGVGLNISQSRRIKTHGVGAVATGDTGFMLLDDGSSFVLLDDGSSKIILTF